MDDAGTPPWNDTAGAQTPPLQRKGVRIAAGIFAALAVLSLLALIAGRVLDWRTGDPAWEDLTEGGYLLFIGAVFVLGMFPAWDRGSDGRIRPLPYLAVYIPLVAIYLFFFS